VNYEPDKYKNQATSFSNGVTNASSTLDSAIDELNNVSSSLELGKNSSNDLLTTNVVSSSEEIKSEIESIKSSINGHSDLISAKATELDEIEKAKYEAYLRQQEAFKRKQAKLLEENENMNVDRGTIEKPNRAKFDTGDSNNRLFW
jgi:hypothetical protein